MDSIPTANEQRTRLISLSNQLTQMHLALDHAFEPAIGLARTGFELDDQIVDDAAIGIMRQLQEAKRLTYDMDRLVQKALEKLDETQDSLP